MQSYSNTLELYRAELSDMIIATLINLGTVAECINQLAKLGLAPDQILAAEAIRADLLMGAAHKEWFLDEFREPEKLDILNSIDFLRVIQTKHLHERFQEHVRLNSRKLKDLKPENWHSNMDEILQDADNRQIIWVNVSGAKRVSRYIHNKTIEEPEWLKLDYSNDLTLHAQDYINARVLDQEKITGIILYDGGFNRTMTAKQKRKLEQYLFEVANGKIAKLFGKDSLKLVFMTSMLNISSDYQSFNL